MHSKDPLTRLEDIIENIRRIERCTAGMDAKSFASDTKTADAVERCLARISEAAVKLGAEAEKLCPGISWRDIRGLGNRLRHEYTTVDVGRIWLMVEKDVPHLMDACRAAVERLENGKGKRR